MTDEHHGSSPTDRSADDSGRRARPSAGGERSVERLEQELAEEIRVSAELRRNLDGLSAKVAELEAGFERRLADANARNDAAETKMAEQRSRLEALGNGREETMLALSAARAELARLAIERDELRKQLERIDGMQTETVTLPDESDEEPQVHQTLPSIEDLMANLSSMDEAPAGGHETSQLHKVEAVEDGLPEMIAPELVFPEQYEDDSGGAEHDRGGGAGSEARRHASRVLVLLDADPPIKYPLYKDVMTIGRSDTADIQIVSDFVSRVHARIVATDEGLVVEDVDSKNGIRVNTKTVQRERLRHGDVIAFGRLRFTFIDTDAVGAG
jgi:hypothetical protein